MQNKLLIVAACLALGLAPFFPEPHIVGKIRWILGGAEGMTLMDWWDTILHGIPWLILVYLGIQGLLARKPE